MLLAERGVKATANRMVVAKALSHAGRPVSMSELEEELVTFDKSSIFRTLVTFREHHLVHVIEDGGDGVRYELCHSHHIHEDDDMHAHFFCTNCHKTFCLDNAPIPEIALPDGFKMSSVNYLVKGLCPECQTLNVEH